MMTHIEYGDKSPKLTDLLKKRLSEKMGIKVHHAKISDGVLVSNIESYQVFEIVCDRSDCVRVKYLDGEELPSFYIPADSSFLIEEKCAADCFPSRKRHKKSLVLWSYSKDFLENWLNKKGYL